MGSKVRTDVEHPNAAGNVAATALLLAVVIAGAGADSVAAATHASTAGMTEAVTGTVGNRESSAPDG